MGTWKRCSTTLHTVYIFFYILVGDAYHHMSRYLSLFAYLVMYEMCRPLLYKTWRIEEPSRSMCNHKKRRIYARRPAYIIARFFLLLTVFQRRGGHCRGQIR